VPHKPPPTWLKKFACGLLAEELEIPLKIGANMLSTRRFAARQFAIAAVVRAMLAKFCSVTSD